MLKRMIPSGILTAMLVGMLSIAQGSAVYAMQDDEGGENGAEKVTICHRTNSIKNPYVATPVDADSIDGDDGNDNGQGDHYLEHLGPLPDPATMTNSDDWGDIIPPIDGVHDGRNWSTEGQAIYNAGCTYPDETELMAETSVTAICDVTNQVVKLTFVNNGNLASAISVNGAASAVAAGETVNVTTPITGAKVSVNVVIDDVAQVVNVTCPTGGSGTVTPLDDEGDKVTPAVVTTGGSGAAAGIASLPVTSGGSENVAAIVALITSVLSGAGAYIVRMRNAAML